MRLMTYNIRSGRGVDGRLNLDRIARVIEAEQPDVVALQEVDLSRRRTRNLDQAGWLARELGLHHIFGAARSWKQGAYGNALLSRFELVDWQPWLLPRPGRLPVESRGVLQATLRTPMGLVRVWNTHLGLLAPERRLQVAYLVQNLALEAPLIVCGDFNARPRSKELLGLQEVLQRVPTQRTFPGFLPVVQLDHVFHCPMLQPLHHYVVRTPLSRRASDHLPLVVDLAPFPSENGLKQTGQLDAGLE